MKTCALILLILSSCSSVKPKYTPSPEPARVMEQPKKEKQIVAMHVWILIMTGFCFHVLGEDSK